jgi:hypothetical protein
MLVHLIGGVALPANVEDAFAVVEDVGGDADHRAAYGYLAGDVRVFRFREGDFQITGELECGVQH